MHSYTFCVSAVPWAAAHDAGQAATLTLCLCSQSLAHNASHGKPAGPWCAWCGAQAMHDSLGPVRAREGRASASTWHRCNPPLGPLGGHGGALARKSRKNQSAQILLRLRCGLFRNTPPLAPQFQAPKRTFWVRFPRAHFVPTQSERAVRCRIITDHTAQPIADFPGGAVGRAETQTGSANC